jgi:uncharacterized protein YlzI (FlbEa/FlbD family)
MNFLKIKKRNNMQTKFIELTSDNFKHHINCMMICGITKNENANHTTINMMGGQVYSVTETTEEVLKLIGDAEKFTLITK